MWSKVKAQSLAVVIFILFMLPNISKCLRKQVSLVATPGKDGGSLMEGFAPAGY